MKSPNTSFTLGILIVVYLCFAGAVGWGMWNTFKDARLFLRSDLFGLTIDIVRTGELTGRYMRELEKYLQTQNEADLSQQILHIEILRGREGVIMSPLERLPDNSEIKKSILVNLKIYIEAMESIRSLLDNSPMGASQKNEMGDLIFKADNATGTIYTRTQYFIQSNIARQNHIQKTFSVLLVGLVVILLIMLGGLALALKKLHVAQGRAENANKDKSMFLAAASHDMRQPLQAMTLFFYALKKNLLKPEDLKIVGHLEKSTASMGQILNKLLDLSRLESGVIKIDKMNFSVGAIFNRLVAEYGPMACEKGLNLKCIPCSWDAYSDPILFEGMLRNLLSNAIKNTTSGRILIGCRLKATNQLVVQVWDTGSGIPEDQKSKIFNEFYQLDVKHGNAAKGLGLGLSIVQKVSMLLGHELGMTSKLGIGSMFSITVPRAENTIANGLSNLPEKKSPKAKDLSIIVVDDDVAVRESLATMLSVTCKNVFTASEVDHEHEAKMAHFPLNVPDIIIADYRLMHNKTGVQAIVSLCRHYKSDIPAILLTGDTAPERLKEISESGYLLIHKPINGPELLKKIEAVIGQ